jgi:hypothetical protein
MGKEPRMGRVVNKNINKIIKITAINNREVYLIIIDNNMMLTQRK